MTMAGLGLLSPALLSACSSRSGKASSSGTGGHIDTLRVHVPTTLAYMAPMTLFGQQGKLAPTIGRATVENWSSIDVMRTLLMQKQTDLAATPSYAAANLFNKGVPLRLVAMQVWGMLYVVGPEGSSAQGLEALRGKTVAVPMPNNMPDLVFRYLLGQKGWDTDKDLTIQSYTDGQEALSNLLAGNAEFAVLPEHPASVSLARAKQQGKVLERTADLQQIWSEVTGGEAKFPMAGLVMPQEITDSSSQAVGAVLNEVEACIAATNAACEETVSAISQRTEVPAPIVTEVIPRLQLNLVPAAQAKDQLVDFYTRLSTINPDIVGGRMPADDFYLKDPR
ncbi:ABC transporter substrate-binding protein [Actinomyces viscosus]|nr:MqnA/MqnD/SBP family protein [Actinomyces viscosus]TFH53236.1 ABC transporter substrate-binding protein [Actinomyces viscosus]